MSPLPPTALSENTAALCTLLIILVPLCAAGVTLTNTGLARSRSAAHSMLASLFVMAVAALAYFAIGSAVEGYAGRAAHVLRVGGKAWNVVGAGLPMFRGLSLDASPASLAAVLQIFAVGLAAVIPLGSGAERWRIAPMCWSTVLLAGWTYPLFAHWAWAGGWLAQMGANYGLGRGFLDAGGGSTIQAVGGLTALAIAWILGPRRGRYAHEHTPAAFPGHNIVFVVFGCTVSFAGWMALNSAGALLFAGTPVLELPGVLVKTMLSGAASVLTSVAITRGRFGKPDASLAANAWMGGLAASSAGCAFLTPWQSVLTGALAGTLVTFAVLWMDHVSIDDPGGSIAVHAVGGMWGILSVGIFVHGQFVAQLVGVATLVGFILPLTYTLNWLLNRVSTFRIDPRGERHGMDVSELGAGAYPEAVD